MMRRAKQGAIESLPSKAKRLDWRLAMLVLSFAPMPALIAASAAPEQTLREQALLNRWAKIYSRFNEVLSGLLIVRSFAMEDAEKARFLRDVGAANEIVVRHVDCFVPGFLPPPARLAGQLPSNVVDDIGPIAGCSLPEQAHGRILDRPVAAFHPAPVAFAVQHQPYRYRKGAAEMSGECVDREQQVEFAKAPRENRHVV
jgi:hypothetical protein